MCRYTPKFGERLRRQKPVSRANSPLLQLGGQELPVTIRSLSRERPCKPEACSGIVIVGFAIAAIS